MPDLTQQPGFLSVLLAVCCAACWYIAVHAAAWSLRSAAWSIVVAAALPGLAGVAWFSADGRPDGAISLALATAVTLCTLVLGIVCHLEPLEGKRLLEDPGRRLKATLLPSAVALLVIGFSGVMRVFDAAVLLAACALVVWLAGPGRTAQEPPASEAMEAEPAPSRSARAAGVVQLLMALALALAGAGFAVATAAAAGRHHGRIYDATSAILMAAFIALPLLGVAIARAGFGQAPAAQRGLTLAAVFMITLGVPAAVSFHIVQQIMATELTGEAMLMWLQAPPSLPLAMRFWRIDAVVLCIVGLLVLPSAAGRFRMGKTEGTGLIVLYVVYLVLAGLAGG